MDIYNQHDWDVLFFFFWKLCVYVCVFVDACVESVCLGPLAGAVSGLLDGVADPCGVAAAIKLHRAPLQPCLPAALTEASVRVDVVVIDAGGWTLSITGNDVHLQDMDSRLRHV